MPYLGNILWGCCELVDNRRTLAYRASACATTGYRSVIHPSMCCECDTIPDGFPCVDPPFTTPMGDFTLCNTPGSGVACPWWVDPLIPESGDVFGLWMTNWEELNSTATVDSQQVLGGGRAFGRRQEFGRCITMSGWIESRTCCGARYMVQALQQRLIQCPGDSVYVLDCCPTAAETEEQKLRHILEFPNAKLTTPVTVLDRRGGCCPDCTGTAVKVQWTVCFPREDIWLGAEDVCTGPLVAPGGCTDPCSGGCPTNPCNLCNPSAEETFDAEYWTGLLGGQSIACDCPTGRYTDDVGCCDPAPYAKPPLTVSSGCWIPPQNMHIVSCSLQSKYRWHPSSLGITINAGAADLENLRIVAFPRKDAAETCPTTQAEFEAKYRCQTPMLDLRIIGVKANSTLVIDPVQRYATITYPGRNPVPAWSLIDANGSGSVMNALDFGTCDLSCLFVVMDCNNVSAGSTYSMSLRPRKSSSF